jgi:Tol biopolymer transport system component
MKIVGTLLTLVALTTAEAQHKEGAQYFNQSAPGLNSQIFAPGIISTDNESEFGSIYSKDGSEFYYSIQSSAGKAELRQMKRTGNAWSKPEVMLGHDTYSYNDPFLSPDEKRLYFISDQPLGGKGPKKDFDIWYVERHGTAWSNPINAGPNINSSKNEYYTCITADGTIYFSSNVKSIQTGKDDYDVFMARPENGEFKKAVRVDSPVNTESYEGDVYVAPDESYLIVCSDRPGGYGAGDLYISFRKNDGSWGDVKNMGKEVNEDRYQYCPIVTPDGKYLLFTSKDNIRWIDAKVIDKFR